MLVCGPKEAESGAVSVRGRKAGDMGSKALGEFIAELQQEIAEKRLKDTSGFACNRGNNGTNEFRKVLSKSL